MIEFWYRNICNRDYIHILTFTECFVWWHFLWTKENLPWFNNHLRNYIFNNLFFSFRLFPRYYWKNSIVREECDAECKKRMLCDLKSGRSNDRKVTCAKIEAHEKLQERNDWTNWIFSGITVTYVWVASIFS